LVVKKERKSEAYETNLRVSLSVLTLQDNETKTKGLVSFSISNVACFLWLFGLRFADGFDEWVILGLLYVGCGIRFSIGESGMFW
jgi:hypothetical protein